MLDFGLSPARRGPLLQRTGTTRQRHRQSAALWACCLSFAPSTLLSTAKSGMVQRWVTVSPVACDRKTGRFPPPIPSQATGLTRAVTCYLKTSRLKPYPKSLQLRRTRWWWRGTHRWRRRDDGRFRSALLGRARSGDTLRAHGFRRAALWSGVACDRIAIRRFRDSLEYSLDYLVDIHAFRVGIEVGEDPVSQNRIGQPADILRRNCKPSLQYRPGLSPQDHVLRGSRARPPS